jgi:hypothetical protein
VSTGRADERRRTLLGAAVIALILVVVALLLLSSGHWIFGILFGIAAVVAIWVVLQLRTVR